MARTNVPTIPDDKIYYYREQLFRELSHMFEWKKLPQTMPADYIERNLVRNGRVLVYYDENIGLDVLRCEVVGYNRHDQPTSARTFTPTTNNEVNTQITRNIKYLSDSEEVNQLFDQSQDGVVINNMAYGEHAWSIVNHFAKRLALAQQAFDTNLMWANVPYIFLTSDEDTRLSIERMFSKIFTGEPFIISDKDMFTENENRQGVPTDIDFIGKDLLDVQNEIMMKFKQTVGFDTAGVDKAERTNTLEIASNEMHTKTVLQIMLEQRKIACEAINEFFGENIDVDITGREELEERHEEEVQAGGEEDGTDNGGTPQPSSN